MVVCEAFDVTNLADEAVDAAVDKQQCAPSDDVGDDVMKAFVDQHATVGIGLCVVHEIFSAIQAIDGGFDGCFWLTVNLNYLKVKQTMHVHACCALLPVCLGARVHA